MTPLPVPVAVRLLVRLTLPGRARAQAVADLEDDYSRERAARGRLGAYIWLMRESLSLAAAYTRARAARIARSGPILIRDLVLVLRGLRRGPIPALGAAAMLSTGLLAMLLTAGLSEALLFRPISRLHGDRLRRISEADRQGRVTTRVSYPELEAIRAQLDGHASVAAVSLQPIVIRDGDRSLQTMVEVADGSYFGIMGIATVIGRPLLAADDRPDAAPVAVISQPLWTTRFAQSPAVLGQRVDINGAPFTVVGVAAAYGSSAFVAASVDAWVTSEHADSVLNRGWRTNVGDRAFAAFALPAEDSGEIDGRLATVQADLARVYPEQWRDRTIATAAATVLTGTQRSTMRMLAAILLALSTLILATSATNLTGVFVARAAVLRRQFAIHLAVGSGRAPIVRRQIMEGALVGLIGSVFAAGLYAWARVWLAEIALLPTLTLRLELPLDVRLFALVALTGAIAGGTLALGPALWAARVDLAAAMRDGGSRVIAGRGLSRVRQVLVSAQVGFSLVLMVGAVLFVRSLDALVAADIGFPRDRLVAMDLDVEPSSTTAADLPALARDVLRRAADVPGVAGAALSNRAPVDQSTPVIDVHVGNPEGAAIGSVTFYLATAGYFDTVGVPVVRGRGFTADEVDRAADVAVVNETLAERAWPGGDAIGQALYLEQDGRTLRVIGVARNSKYRTIDEPPRPHIYRPVAPRFGLTLLARTSDDPRQVLVRMQRSLDEAGPGVTGFFPRTLDDHLAIELLPARAAASAASVLGVLALIFSGVGLYGLVSWFVAMRRGELGVRMALGASRRDVARLVIGQAASAAAPGVAAGLVLAIALALFVRKALFGVAPVDAGALAIALTAIVLIVSISAYAPARRAAKIDPAATLRT